MFPRVGACDRAAFIAGIDVHTRSRSKGKGDCPVVVIDYPFWNWVEIQTAVGEIIFPYVRAVTFRKPR